MALRSVLQSVSENRKPSVSVMALRVGMDEVKNQTGVLILIPHILFASRESLLTHTSAIKGAFGEGNLQIEKHTSLEIFNIQVS